MAKRRTTRRREKKGIVKGIAHIHSTFNNTIVTITDPNGSVVCWASAGTCGFKGTKREPHLPLNWQQRQLLRKPLIRV